MIPAQVADLLHRRYRSADEHLRWSGPVVGARPAVASGGRWHDLRTALWVATSGARVPPRHVVQAVCRRALCVRPGHLQAVAPARVGWSEDGFRSIEWSEAVCPRGHDLRAPKAVLEVGDRRRCAVCTRERTVERRVPALSHPLGASRA